MEIARIEAARKAKRNKRIAIIVPTIVCTIIACVVLLSTVIIPNNKYNKAVSLMDAGEYDEAILVFEALDGYKDSADKMLECTYVYAIALMDAGEYDEAILVFETLDGYKDSTDKILEYTYAYALASMDAAKWEEAYIRFKELGDYKDAAAKAEAVRLAQLKAAQVGDYVRFGTYEQDNNTANGKEEIEWLVLEVKDGKALVISKYILDCQPYDTRQPNVTWEICSLRNWLNNDFINAAFSADEKAIIPTVTVPAGKNPEYKTNPGEATQDQVFLLSIREAKQYFRFDSARQHTPTDYADANGAGNNWCLRSPGIYQSLVAYVDREGNVIEYGLKINGKKYAVLPALWIDLSKI